MKHSFTARTEGIHLLLLFIFSAKAGKGKCIIDKARRNWCSYCRLQRCFQARMNVAGNFVFLFFLVPISKTLPHSFKFDSFYLHQLFKISEVRVKLKLLCVWIRLRWQILNIIRKRRFTQLCHQVIHHWISTSWHRSWLLALNKQNQMKVFYNFQCRNVNWYWKMFGLNVLYYEHLIGPSTLVQLLLNSKLLQKEPFHTFRRIHLLHQLLLSNLFYFQV